MNDLRRSLRERDVEYRVVKNTLAYIAADEVERPELKEIIQGATGLAFGYGDPISVAQALEEFIRTSRSSLTINGGMLGQRLLKPHDVSTLAALPPKEQIISTLLGQVQAPLARLLTVMESPMAGLVTTLRGPLAGLSIVLQQRAQNIGVGG
jgi:large subunit ribosomal protein L10